jgi:hypothetical protein
MRILVVGDRHWNCPEPAKQLLSRLLARYGPAIVVNHGGECGIDQAVATACKGLGVAVEARLVSFEQTGLLTIATNNRELLKTAPDLCVVVHQSIHASKRTRNCVIQALQAGAEYPHRRGGEL